jgi:uncharacterized protein
MISAVSGYKKMMMIMANTDPNCASAIIAPLSQASVAASMGYPVEIVLTGRSGELAQKDFASKMALPNSPDKTVSDLIKECVEAGVVFKVCSPVVSIWGEDLISEIHEIVGAAYVISEVMEGDTVTMTY